jgi:hypothetical protein
MSSEELYGQKLTLTRFRWIMHKTGEFRKLMIICGIMPFVAGIFVVQMKESSGIVSKWLSIVSKLLVPTVRSATDYYCRFRSALEML